MLVQRMRAESRTVAEIEDAQRAQQRRILLSQQLVQLLPLLLPIVLLQEMPVTQRLATKRRAVRTTDAATTTAEVVVEMVALVARKPSAQELPRLTVPLQKILPTHSCQRLLRPQQEASQLVVSRNRSRTEMEPTRTVETAEVVAVEVVEEVTSVVELLEPLELAPHLPLLPLTPSQHQSEEA